MKAPLRQSRYFGFMFVAFFLLLVAAFLAPIIDNQIQAAALLTRMTSPNASGTIEDYRRNAVDESLLDLPSDAGPIHARVFVPRDVEHPPALVLVHGLQHRGMDEPRLMSFARAIASTGITVLTPQLPGIADFQITRDSIEVIGNTAKSFSETRNGRPVGIIGMSFSGGLALMAAADPRFAPSVAFVVSVGGHHDLARVAHFYATGETTRPDGSSLKIPPHEYGPLVLVFGSLDDFFSSADVPIARESMRLLLYEEVDASRKKAEELSPGGQRLMAQLFQHDQRGIHSALLESIRKNEARLADLSPRGHLDGLRAPVLLLHGSGDNIIPQTESLWLANEIPPQLLQGMLTTPLLSHVDFQKVSWQDKLAVIEFIARLHSLAHERA